MSTAVAVAAVDALRISYPRPGRRWMRRRSFAAVDGVSFSIAASEVLGVVGESGCGKSSLARGVLRLKEASGGRVVWDGHDVTDWNGERLRIARRALQVVFQDPTASLDPRMTIGESIERPLLNYPPVAATNERRSDVARWIERVGLDPAWAARYPHELSGGQCQRASIARALILAPRLLVCDEPVSSLDVSTQAQIVDLLLDLRAAQGLALLFISHNMAVVRLISDRVLVLYLGKVVEVANRDAFFAAPLHPYGRALIAAVPTPDPVVEQGKARLRLHGIDIPSPLDPPSGCRFRTRCPHAVERCSIEEPPLRLAAPDRWVACHFAEALA